MTEQPVANKQTQPNVANKPKFFKKPFIAGSKPQQQSSQQPQMQQQKQPQQTQQPQQQKPVQQMQQQQKPQFKK